MKVVFFSKIVSVDYRMALFFDTTKYKLHEFINNYLEVIEFCLVRILMANCEVGADRSGEHRSGEEEAVLIKSSKVKQATIRRSFRSHRFSLIWVKRRILLQY